MPFFPRRRRIGRPRGLLREDSGAQKTRASIRPGVEALEGRVVPSLGPLVNYPVVSFPAAVEVGDFNGDGKLDLAVANGDTISILLGAGNGTFAAAGNFSIGTNPQASALAVGDFNG